MVVAGVVRTRWSALAASALIQCFAGGNYLFGVYSGELKRSQSYDQSALDAVAFFKDVGANAGVLSGLLAAWAPLGRRRPWLVLLAGATLCVAGYLSLWWLVVAGDGAGGRPVVGLPVVCACMLMAAQAQTFFNTGNVVTAVENFSDRRGTVIGIMKGFIGLGGAVVVQIYHTLNIKPTSFMVMLAVLPSSVALLLMYFVEIHDTHRRYNKKFLDAFSLIAVSVAAYLMLIITCDQAFTITSAAQTPVSVILLLLVLSPLVVAVKAQNMEPESPEETTGLVDEKDADCIIAACSSAVLEQSGRGDCNLLQAMCTLNFWLLCLAMACGMGSGLATVNNIGQIGGSLGYTARETSTLVSLWSIWNFSGRFGAGYVSDHFLRTRGVCRPLFIAVTLLTMSVGHATISSGLPASLYAGSVLVGLCYGSQWGLMPSITSEIFGLEHFGTIFNTVAIASPIGSYILSVQVVGYIYDAESSDRRTCIGKHCFALSFTIMACVCLFGSAVAFALFKRTRRFYEQVVCLSL